MADQQHVVIAQDHGPADPLAGWEPVVGAETLSVVSGALPDDEARARVLSETRRILARCVNPVEGPEPARSGLVIGYVQSGKTLSFTALTAMARDNHFPLVILLAGTKLNLNGQTVARLRRDLRVERPAGLSPWAVMSNPANPEDNPADLGLLATYLKNALDETLPAKFRKTIVVTILKHSRRMEAVAELLAKLPSQGVDTASLPVLIIDDEADQAGMNAGKGDGGAKSETPTYANILDLRSKVPNNSYVMYTATPQAPLLISLADSLSPEFVNVLTPGAGYTGGRAFFGPDQKDFVSPMGSDEVAAALDPAAAGPPESLQKALAHFLLAKTLMDDEILSMLVHPSHMQDPHTRFKGFVDSLLQAWAHTLRSGGLDREQLVEDYFEPAWKIIGKGGRVLPDLDVALAEVPHWIAATRVRLVNSENSDEINWSEAPAWIVIGGNSLDRGYTIEGLATTYMPRGAGVGNADTIQQRARFFGYKDSYKDLCHAWMSADLAGSYRDYVDHEEHLRSEMIKAQDEGLNLKTWTRRMLLDASMKATRRAVIKLPILHNKFRGGSWTSIDRLGKLSSSVASKNRAVVDLLRAKYSVQTEHDPADPRDNPGNERFFAPMAEVLKLLVEWEGNVDDVILLQQLVLVMQAHLDDDSTLEVAVYSMDGFEHRKRTLSADQDSVDLAQGRNPKAGYEGDSASCDDSALTVQLHNVRNQDGDQPWEAVGLRIRVPKELSGAAIFQYEADE